MDSESNTASSEMSSSSTFVDAMDKYSEKMSQTPLVEGLGENGHTAYSWSKDIKEKLTQVFFQLTRTKNSNIVDEFIKISKEIYENDDDELNDYCMRIIPQTRDIISGKGEYDLAYRLLLEYALHIRESTAKQILYFMVNPLPIEGNEHPYGSWKDIKKFLGYVREYKEKLKAEQEETENTNKEDPRLRICNELIAYCINLYIIQLQKDMEAVINKTPEKVSLCAKWVPREKSKYSWIFSRLSLNIFKNGESFNAINAKERKNCYKKMRVLISALNKTINTVEIKQCANKYSEIEFSKVPSIAMTRYKKAFLNIKSSGTRRSNDEDRIKCSEKFAEYIHNLVSGKTKVNSKRNNITDLVSSALINEQWPYSDNREDEQKLIDAQWKEFTSTIGELPEMVAMVDVSGSMYGDPLLAAIGLGLCVAQKSRLGQRVLTFHSNPSWVNLEDCDGSFVKMVDKIKNAKWGGSTHFYKACKLILDRIIENKLTQEEASNMVLVIFSDMQINMALGDCNMSSMMNKIKNMYRTAGIETTGKPYDPPHILFWNLRSTDNFPSLSSTENTTMLSGYSPQMLNEFIQHGIDGMKKITPYTMMVQILNNVRYHMNDLVDLNCHKWMRATSKVRTKPDREYIVDNIQNITE
jgi:hypothetical protein